MLGNGSPPIMNLLTDFLKKIIVRHKVPYFSVNMLNIIGGRFDSVYVSMKGGLLSPRLTYVFHS